MSRYVSIRKFYLIREIMPENIFIIYFLHYYFIMASFKTLEVYSVIAISAPLSAIIPKVINSMTESVI
jgi:hypothetical protein